MASLSAHTPSASAEVGTSAVASFESPECILADWLMAFVTALDLPTPLAAAATARVFFNPAYFAAPSRGFWACTSACKFLETFSSEPTGGVQEDKSQNTEAQHPDWVGPSANRPNWLQTDIPAKVTPVLFPLIQSDDTPDFRS